MLNAKNLKQWECSKSGAKVSNNSGFDFSIFGFNEDQLINIV